MKKIILTSLISLASALTMDASIADDAAALIEAGDFQAAREVINAALASGSDAKESGRLAYLSGVCNFEENLLDEALLNFETAKKKGVADANLYLGRIAFLDFDFPKAQALYNSYKTAKKSSQSPLLADFTDQLSRARRMLDHVESVEVIDSICVDYDEFFTAYRLPASAGRLISPAKMPQPESRDLASMAFTNELGDYMLWSEPDSVGVLRIVEASKLTDGAWSNPVVTPDILNMEGDADYPFMMADGTTLYYACNGEESIGGYDLFVASRDAGTGEYLQPQNLGMPFNSPFDDYMLAIDEINGIGWWATDRNRIPGKVTIYVYALPEMRRNIDADDDNLISLARLDNYKSTWPDDVEKREALETLLANINHIDTRPPKQVDFRLPMPGGNVYTTWSDFSSRQAASLMREYLKEKETSDKTDAELQALRREYSMSGRNSAQATKIATLEKQAEQRQAALRKKLSEIYRIELLR